MDPSSVLDVVDTNHSGRHTVFQILSLFFTLSSDFLKPQCKNGLSSFACCGKDSYFTRTLGELI